MIAYTKPSYRGMSKDPERRLLAAILVRTYRDLSSRSTHLKQAAVEFFDDEGVAWAMSFGYSEREVRQKLTEAMGG